MGLDPMSGVLIRRDQDPDAHRGVHVRTQEEMAICTPGREAPGGTNPANAVILDVQPLDCETINAC